MQHYGKVDNVLAHGHGNWQGPIGGKWTWSNCTCIHPYCKDEDEDPQQLCGKAHHEAWTSQHAHPEEHQPVGRILLRWKELLVTRISSHYRIMLSSNIHSTCTPWKGNFLHVAAHLQHFLEEEQHPSLLNLLSCCSWRFMRPCRYLQTECLLGPAYLWTEGAAVLLHSSASQLLASQS